MADLSAHIASAFRRMGLAPLLMAVLAALVCLHASPCAAQAKRRASKPAAAAVRKAPAAKEARPKLTDAQRRRFDAFFLEAAVQKQKRNYDAAYDLLRHALGINPDAPEALVEMANLIDAAGGNDSVARGMLQKAVSLEPDNYFYQSRLADFYDDHGESDSAVARYEVMSRKFADRDELLYSLVDIYSSQKNYPALVRTLKRLEVQEGKSSELTLRLANAYSMAGHSDTALAIVDTLIASDPRNSSARVFRGTVYESMGQGDRAEQEYRAVLAADSANEAASVAMFNHYLASGDTASYLRAATAAATDERLSIKARAAALNSMVMSGARGTVDSTAALPAFRKIMAQQSPDPVMLDLYQAYLAIIKAPADTMAAVWKALLAAKPDYSQVRMKLLEYAVKKADNALADSLCRGGVEYEPDNLVYYFYGAIAQYSTKRSVKAALTLEKGLAHTTPDTNAELLSDYYALLGDIRHEIGDAAGSYQAYDSALVYKEDNINALNNYAYFLSLEKKDLDRAAAMSLRTIKAVPSSATYLDTYAWVLFELKRYDEAATYIDQALRNLSDKEGNASIYEHAGDIYSMQGKTREAVEMWRKAKQEGGDAKRLARKIKKKKYLE